MQARSEADPVDFTVEAAEIVREFTVYEEGVVPAGVEAILGIGAARAIEPTAKINAFFKIIF